MVFALLSKIKIMKNTIAVLAVSSLIALSACKKGENTAAAADKTEALQPEKLVVDSVKVNDSVKIADSLTVRFTSKMLVFPTLKDKTLLDSIYFHHQGIKDFSKKESKLILIRIKTNISSPLKQTVKTGFQIFHMPRAGMQILK